MKKILLSVAMLILLTALLFAFGTTASAEIVKSGYCGEVGENLIWTLDSDGRLEISGIGGMGTYGYYYDRAPWGLNNTDVTEIVINEGVSSIGSYAFYAFTSVTEITIPESVSKIGKYAFYDCEKLTDLRFNAVKVNDFSADNFIFAYCGIAGDGVSVTFGDNVTVVPANMFATWYNSEYKPIKIAEVTFGKSITEIRNYAFTYCDDIAEITIPAKLENIGEYSFFGCTALAEINVDDDNLYYASVSGVLYNKNKQILIKYPPSKPDEEFVVLPETVRIRKGAFYESRYLKNLVIGENLAAIEDNAFENCTALEKIEWKIKNIAPANYGNNVFLNAGSEVSGFRVIIDESTESIPAGMFENSKVSEVQITASLTLLPTDVYNGCKYLKTARLPDTLETIGSDAFNNCDALEYIELPDGLKKISANAFYDCDSLKELKIPQTVTEIREKAFAKCDNLQIVDISESAASIYAEAFYQCEAMTELKLSDGTTYIGQKAFYSCTALKQIRLPDNKCSLGASAFYGCTSVLEIIIPGNIKTVDFAVFTNTTALKKIVFSAPSYELKSTNITNVSNFTIVAHPGGNIEEFAKANAFPFEGVHEFSDNIICTATCTNAGESFNKCNYCDERINVTTTDAKGHTEMIIQGQKPTCTSKGFADFVYCAVCDEIFFEQQVIPATGHSPELIKGKKPTCTEKGTSDWERCTVCDAVVVPQAGLSAIGHSAGEWEVVTEAQIGAEGKEVQKCLVCGEILDEKIIPALPEITYLIGDANGDGKVNAIDARIILRISAQLDSMDNYNVPLAVFDLTGDGKVNAIDARKALRIGAQLE